MDERLLRTRLGGWPPTTPPLLGGAHVDPMECLRISVKLNVLICKWKNVWEWIRLILYTYYIYTIYIISESQILATHHLRWAVGSHLTSCCCDTFWLVCIYIYIHSRKLTWTPTTTPTMTPWKMLFLYQPTPTDVVFRVHVSLPGCIYPVAFIRSLYRSSWQS